MSDLPPAGCQLEVVILAAGQGTRMCSALPKVLHPLGGQPLLGHVLDTVHSLGPDKVHVVVGAQSQAVQERFSAAAGEARSGGALQWVVQEEQLGTGHAVLQALPAITPDATVLVVYGDVPLVSAGTLSQAVSAARGGALALVTADFSDPAQLGRIVRDSNGEISAIVEFADADEQQRQISEINSGILALKGALMAPLLARVQPANAQGEYYLTDLVALAVQDGIRLTGIAVQETEEVFGVNDRVQLAELERCYQRRQAHRLMQAGVTIADPARLDIRGEVSAGQDCFIDVNVVLEGAVTLGRGVSIGAGCVITDTRLGDQVVVEPHCVIEGAEVAARCRVGPFARLRPGTRLAEEVKIGNFVETKKTVVGRGSKASHLTYLGDATIGEGCNVGAGTVTCNYDGVDKHPTRIGDRVFVGTNSTLVAPLSIEADAYVAAGSTITRDVGENELGVARGRQRNISGWVRPDRRKTKGS